MELVREIERLLREEKVGEAFELLIRSAPEDVRSVVESSIKKPEVLKDVGGLWRDLALIVHFVNTSIECSKEHDNRSLVSCVLASINGVKLAKELGMMSIAPKLMINAARALTLMNMKERAERMLIEAERICEEMGDEEALAEVEKELSAIYYEQERFADAKVKVEEAIETFRKLGDFEKLAETLTSAAEIYVKLGDFESAESCYREAEEVYRKLVESEASAKFGLAVLLSNYAVYLRRVARFGEAESKLREALEIFEELEKSDSTFAQFVAAALRHMGDLKREMKEFGEAERYYLLSSRKFREIQERLPGFSAS
ncbi:MAG: tetratricopeptide repeat protein [Archaeoglobaceae archaeon]